MNLNKEIKKFTIYRQTTLNSINGQLILDKKNINKISSHKNLKLKRSFGLNIINSTLTDLCIKKNIWNKTKNSNEDFNKRRERSREKSIESKTKIKNNNLNKNQKIPKKYINYKYNNNYKGNITRNSIKENNNNIKKYVNNSLFLNKNIYNNNNNSFINSFFDNESTIYSKKSDNDIDESIKENEINKNIKYYSRTDLQYVKEYQEDIFLYLTSLERKIKINPNYITTQKDISEKMREILVDWIINVHLKFKLLDETLFLTIILIDRYLEKVQISRNILQLVGVASLFIASKYEEIYPPLAKSFIYITDNAYNRNELLDMERKIFEILEFDISYPSPLRYMEMLVIKLNYINDKIIINKMHFLLELILTKLFFYKYSHIELVITCFLLSYKSCDDNFEKNKECLLQKCFSCFFIFYDKKKVDRIYECLDELEILVKDLFENKNSFKTILKKYQLKKYACISEPEFWKNIIN